MSGLLRWWACCLGTVSVLLLASHCGEDVRIEPPTQITARIRVDAALQYQQLYVQSASQTGGATQWQEGTSQTFQTSALKDSRVIDVVFVPRPGTAQDKQIELVVEARSGSTVLAQERALVSFVPAKQKLLELWLAPCGGQAVCEADSKCHGAQCQACVDGQQCGAVRRYEGNALATFDPNETNVDPNKPRTNGGNNSGAVTCASPSTTIVCDDGNACNGRETCSPGSAGALANGCALESQPITCDPGSTCVKDTGSCASCSERADGDGDGVASTACGGKDCNDNDDDVAPSKTEICDGKDNDCNDTVDDVAAANRDCVRQHGEGSTCAMGACVTPPKEVAIRFRASGFNCSASGPRDFRFFVQQLSLIPATGPAVPVTLAATPFQANGVALIDLNGADCVSGADVNDTITGTVPAGTYVGVQFVNAPPAAGMGPALNPAVTTSTNAVPSLVAVSGSGGGTPSDAGAPDGGTGDGGTAVDAGGSSGGSGKTLYLTAPNQISLPSGFNSERGTVTIIASFAAIVDPVPAGETCEAMAACAASYAALGVPGPAQTVFTVD